MESVDWMGFVLASVAIVLAPGPGSLFVAKTAGSEGVRAGRNAMLGIMLGDSCLIVLSLLGVSALFMACPALFHVLRLAGAGYLILLGLRWIFGGEKTAAAPAQDAVGPFRRAAAITLFNPKAVFFFMAFFPLFIRSAENGVGVPYAVMTLVFMAISGAYLSVVSHVSARVASVLQGNGSLQRAARRVCGCLFVAFGLKVATAFNAGN